MVVDGGTFIGSIFHQRHLFKVSWRQASWRQTWGLNRLLERTNTGTIGGQHCNDEKTQSPHPRGDTFIRLLIFHEIFRNSGDGGHGKREIEIKKGVNRHKMIAILGQGLR